MMSEVAFRASRGRLQRRASYRCCGIGHARQRRPDGLAAPEPAPHGFACGYVAAWRARADHTSRFPIRNPPWSENLAEPA